ncbi:BPSL0761 family protein [Pseudomonas viridiflava]|uniref:BPSL0761 family protein n=1 Tax=Pseudomonas viridiflava TaxID=33069 RepID=UPI002D80C996|nr:BPSL0761 family protein [Pseudomonas viridiflava]
MTMPYERPRCVSQTHAFLTELAGDTAVPERVRQNAHFLLRPFPPRTMSCKLAEVKSKRRNWE